MDSIVVAAADTPGVRGDESLRKYWVHGEGAIKIKWPLPGSFKRCVRHLSKYSKGGTAFDPEGLCAEMYHEAKGVWPGRNSHKGTAVVASDRNYVRDTEGQFADVPGVGDDAPGAFHVFGKTTGAGHQMAAVRGEDGKRQILVHYDPEASFRIDWENNGDDESMVLTPAQADGIANAMDNMVQRVQGFQSSDGQQHLVGTADVDGFKIGGFSDGKDHVISLTFTQTDGPIEDAEPLDFDPDGVEDFTRSLRALTTVEPSAQQKLLKKLDKAKLGDFIIPDPGHTLAATDKFTANEDYDMGMALFQTPQGPKLRVGFGFVTDDIEDELRWVGTNDGATIELDSQQIEAMQSEIKNLLDEHGDAQAGMRDLANEIEDFNGWDRVKYEGTNENIRPVYDPTLTDSEIRAIEQYNAQSDGFIPGTDGVLAFGPWGDLVYGFAYSGGTNDPGEEELYIELAVRPPNSPPDWNPEHAEYRVDPTPKDMKKVAKMFARMKDLAETPITAAMRKYVRDDDGRFAETPGGKIVAALEALRGDDDIDHLYQGVNLADRPGIEQTGRFAEIEHEFDRDGRPKFSLRVGSSDDEDEDEEVFDQTVVELSEDEMAQVTNRMAVSLLADSTPLDPSDMRSVLLHSMAHTGAGGGFVFEDGRAIDYPSNRNGDFWVEFTDDMGQTSSLMFNSAELGQLHAAMVRSLLNGREEADAELYRQHRERNNPTTAGFSPPPPEMWHAVAHTEGESTGSRIWTPGALSWREPPFALHDAVQSSAHGSQIATVQVGNVTRVERIGNEVHMWGNVDLGSPQGLDFGRRLQEGFARWVSMGPDETHIEYDLVWKPGTSMQSEEDLDQQVFKRYKIAELTSVSTPAQHSAQIEPLPALTDALVWRGVVSPDLSAIPVTMAAEALTRPDPMEEMAHMPYRKPITASGSWTLTLPNLPPPEWFEEPPPELCEPGGPITVTDEGRIYGYIAPADIAHRTYARNGERKTLASIGKIDFSRWLKETIVEGGARVLAGPITMECMHAPTQGYGTLDRRNQAYEDTCSIIGRANAALNRGGMWLAGATMPGITAEQITKLMASDMSLDVQPHPEWRGWQEFVACLVVPVGGLPKSRTSPSTAIVRAEERDGEMVITASAVPIVCGLQQTSCGCDGAPEVSEDVIDMIAAELGIDTASIINEHIATIKGVWG